MESSRRPFGGSLSKEPVLRKPRLTEEPAAPYPGANGRRNSISGVPGFLQRPVSSSIRSLCYKTALAELTFNSKPIITNLTIIAGENLHAAKAIAAIVSTNIVEVASEQKLPSLCLLDSIGKNIRRDYIKYFASRLPEVFCKAYRQTLQMIGKELGIATTSSGLFSGTSRPESQAQRPGPSIHVNPKYLEAKQRLQQSSGARGEDGDDNGTMVNSPEDVERLKKQTSVCSGRPWPDPYIKNIQHPDKNSCVTSGDSEYGSDISRVSGTGIGKAIEKHKEQGFEKLRYGTGSDVTGKISNQKIGLDMRHDFQSYPAHKYENSGSQLQLKHNFANRSSSGMNRSWKKSEEEEYMWDDTNSRDTGFGTVDISVKDHWMPDDSERLDSMSHLQRPQSIHGIGARLDNEASSDPQCTGQVPAAPGARIRSLWSHEPHAPERTRPSRPSRNMSGHCEGYPSPFSGLSTSANSIGNAPFLSQVGPVHTGALSFKFPINPISDSPISISQRHILGAASPLAQSPSHQHPSSPSISANDQNQLLHNLAEQDLQLTMNHANSGRSHFLGKSYLGPHNQVSKDSLHMSSWDAYPANSQRLHLPSLKTPSPVIPPLQQRHHVPSPHHLKPELSEFESSGESQKSSLPQISGFENHSIIGNSSSDQSNPLTLDFPGQSSTISLLSAVVKSGILDSSSIMESLPNLSSQDVDFVPAQVGVQPPLPSGPPTQFTSSPPSHGGTSVLTFSHEKVEQPPLPPEPPPSSLAGSSSGQTLCAMSDASIPVSHLLSSLVAKGLISASKTELTTSMPLQIAAQPQDQGVGSASISSNSVSSFPFVSPEQLSSTANELSSTKSAAKSSDSLTQPDVVRKLLPAVISELLDDLPHHCSICGLRLNLQEQLDRHLEWHASRIPGQNRSKKTSRKWYSNSFDWLVGTGGFQPSDSSSGLLGGSSRTLESSEHMVPPDESQFACILCGDLFEDLYRQEINEWMFRGAVYVTIPSSEGRGTTSDSKVWAYSLML
ncbi:ENTH/VHS family protein [Abeliophyllum distichum]|uniref:ENTH/VHS family protein n=1 Tax=Abeliophyllum distichum TaxID=126358 RepID=A0ABD1RH29_9LAMI